MHMISLRLALAALVVAPGYFGWAQESMPPEILPSAPTIASSTTESVGFNGPLAPSPDHPVIVPSHKFFDRQNKLAFASLGALVAADAITTQQLTNSGAAHEANPLWRPLVRQGWPGEMAASALGYSAALGAAYTFHRTGHHKMERWVNWLSVAVEAANVGHNFYVWSGRPRPR